MIDPCFINCFIFPNIFHRWAKREWRFTHPFFKFISIIRVYGSHSCIGLQHAAHIMCLIEDFVPSHSEISFLKLNTLQNLLLWRANSPSVCLGVSFVQVLETLWLVLVHIRLLIAWVESILTRRSASNSLMLDLNISASCHRIGRLNSDIHLGFGLVQM